MEVSDRLDSFHVHTVHTVFKACLQSGVRVLDYDRPASVSRKDSNTIGQDGK